MSYHDVLWPFALGDGSSGGPRTSTIVATQPTGAEQRVQRWQHPRWTYDVNLAVRPPETVRQIQQFLVARRGPLFAFKLRDPIDYSTGATWGAAVTGDDVVLGLGDGATTRFQMVKRYDTGAQEYVRALRRPRVSTLITKVNGIVVTDRTVDPSSGEIIFATAPADGHEVSAGCEFDVVVRADLPDEWAAWQWTSGHKLSMTSLRLIEDLHPAPVAGDFFPGGSTAVSMSVTVQAVSPAIARLWRITPNATGRRIILPNPLDIPDGIDILRIHNAGPQSIALEDHLAGSLGTLASTKTAFVDLLRESDGDKTWIVVVS